MKILISIVFLSLFFISDVNSQELIYDISVSGRKIGNLLVTKTETDENTTYYSAVSDVQYTLFKKTEMVYLYEAVFKDNSLTKAYFIYKKNGEVEEESKLLWSEDGVYLSNIESFHKKQKSMLQKSMIQMYFQKAVHMDTVFSERFHDFLKIAEVEEENKFIVYIPNGDKNIYYYNEKGICRRVDINTTFLNLEMVLQNDLDEE